MRMTALALAACFLVGCASPDIDLSKSEPFCSQPGSSNYSQCVGKFTLVPIVHQSQCNDALRICAQSCPAR